MNNRIRRIARSAQSIAGLAVLLIALLVSCQNPVDSQNAAPSGTVTITLAGAGGAARSTMPSAPSFSRYALTLQKGETTQTPDAGGLAADGVTVQLEPGTWSVTVDAFQELDHDGNAETPTKEYKAATATASLTVETGGINSIEVQLEPVAADDAPQGVFAWNITLPESVDSTTMSLGTVSGITGLDLTQMANRSGSAEVDSGVYSLTIILGKDGLSTSLIEKVYIYGGLQTTAALDLRGVVFGAEVLIAGTLTVTNNGGPASGYVVNAYASEADANSESSLIGTASISSMSGTSGAFLLGIPVSDYNALETGTASGKKVYIRATHSSSEIRENSVVTMDNLPQSGATGKNVSITMTDLRTELTAGNAVNVGASAITANVTFTGATGLTLTAADFVAYSGTINAVSVSGDTATVSVSFAANTSTTAARYTQVSIASNSAKIKGSTTVNIIQAKAIGSGTSMASAMQLTLNTWANGELASGGEQWFAFTATAANQYIHVSFGTLTDLYVQLYDSGGNTSGSRVNLWNSITYTSMSVTSGNVYYIKVTPYSGTGTYKIGFTTSADVTPDTVAAMASATQLTLNTWANGELTAGGSHWYKFTATAANQYIHFAPGTLTNVYVQLRNSGGNTSGSRVELYSGYTSTSVISGNEYYIEVWPYSSGYSGTYKIGFTTSADVTPDTVAAMASATQLTLNTWANREMTAGGSHWYKFTATAANQYIHFAPGTLTNLYVQLRNSAGNKSGSSVSLSSYTSYTALSIGNVYYIEVWPYSGGGTYKIGFTTSAEITPDTVAAMASATQLTLNTWTNGELTVDGSYWYKFTATTANQYIHFAPGTLTYLYAQLYDSGGNTSGSRVLLYSSGTYTSTSVISGNVYYIKVTPYSGTGTYKIGFNTSTTPPSQ